MSATNRGAVRADLDFYETPAWAVRAILPHLPASAMLILDAGSGTGAITREAARHWPGANVMGVELDPGRVAEALAAGCPVSLGDFLHGAFAADLVIMNPPFNLAMEFVRHALRVAPVVAALLRLPWLASQGRADWMRANTPSVYVLPRRPSFCAVVTCERRKGKRPTCTFQVMLPPTAPRPARCPLCDAAVTVTTADATDYFWALWDGRPPTVRILDVEAGR